MLEINPVLAGTFDAPGYMPAATNFNTAPAAADTAKDVSSVSNTAKVDPRRYSQFDRTSIEAGTATDFSFSDFLDMVNPLQHIPVASSVYRSITGDTINPISRVAGDVLYGGIFGIASAVMGAAGAAGDAVAEAETGKDVGGNVIATLFGTGDDKAKTQIAQTDPAKSTDAQALAATAAVAPTVAAPAAATPALTPDQAIAALTAQAAQQTQATDASAAPLMQAKAFPLDRSKLPYGGVMDPSGSMEAQNTAIALSEGSHAMRLGHTIYTSRLMNGPHPLPVASPPPDAGASAATATATTAPTATAASTPVPAPATAADATPAMSSPVAGDIAKTGPQKNPIPQNLVDDMVMLKALNQYKCVAAGPSSLGASVDVTN